jgi:MFS family permease
MKADLGITDMEAGLILTVSALSVAFFSYPVSYLIDRWSRKKMIALMSIMWSIFSFTTGLARNIAALVVSRSLVGTSSSAYGTGGMVWITAAYPPEKHGLVLGIFNVAIPVGMTVGVVVGGLLSVQYGWRTPFLVFAPLGMIFGIATLFLKDYKTVKHGGESKENSFFRSIGYLLKIRTLRWYYAGYGFMLLMSLSSAWGSALMIRQVGCKEDVAGYFLGAGVIFAVAGSLFGGRIGDTWGRRNQRSRLLIPAVVYGAGAVIQIVATLALMSAPQGSGLLTIGFITNAVLSAFGTFIYYIGLPPLAAVSQEVVTPDRKGASWGLAVLCMYLIGGAWSPLIVGGISDAMGGGAWGLATGILVTSIGGFIAAFCFYMGSRYYVSDAQKVKGMVIEN